MHGSGLLLQVKDGTAIVIASPSHHRLHEVLKYLNTTLLFKDLFYETILLEMHAFKQLL